MVAAFADADVMAPRWVNDGRLVFQVSNSTNNGAASAARPMGREPRRQRVPASDPERANWETEGSGQIKDRRLDANWTIFDTLSDGSDDVLVYRRRWLNEPESMSNQLARLDTRSGRVKGMSQGLPLYVYGWTVDWRGEPRAVTAESGGRSLTLVKAPFEGRTAVYRLDPKTQQPEAQPLIRFPGYDYDGTLVDDPATGQLLGVHFETDAPGTVWFSSQIKTPIRPTLTPSCRAAPTTSAVRAA